MSYEFYDISNFFDFEINGIAMDEEQIDVKIKEALSNTSQIDSDWEKSYKYQKWALELHYKQIESFSLAAMKAPSLAAAGGIAAVLGFYSANYDRLSVIESKLDDFNSILLWWSLALLISIVLPGLSYLGQMSYVDRLSEQIYDSDAREFADNDVSKRHLFIGDFFRVFAMFLMCVSYIFLVLGGYHFYKLAQ